MQNFGALAATPGSVVAGVEAVIWFVVAAVVVARVSMTIAQRGNRRRKQALTETVIRPVLDSGAVESRAYGWTPAAEHAASTVNDDGRPDRGTAEGP